MKKLVKVSLFSSLALACIALSSCNAQVPKADLKTDIDSVSYAQGVLTATQQIPIDQIFEQLGIGEYKQEYINGFIKGMKNDPRTAKEKAAIVGEWMGTQFGVLMLPESGQQMFQDSTVSLNRNNFAAGYIAMIEDPENALIKEADAQSYIMNIVLTKQYPTEKAENAAFLEKNKSAEGVKVLPSGLQYKVVVEGNGPKPVATDQVKVHYHGTTTNGEVFDSSVERGEPVTFPLNGVIKGWTEGLQLMPVGSKYIFYIPYDLAYGAAGNGRQIGPFATLVFEVELQDIVKEPQGSEK